MSAALAHPPLSAAAKAWLRTVLDPRQRRAPKPLNATELGPVLEAAQLHGVLPTVVQAAGSVATDGMAAQLTAARTQLVHQAGFQLALRHHSQRIMTALTAAGVAAQVVKGPVFAERLYGPAALRTFTDVDLLIDPAGRPQAASLLTELGFRLFTFDSRMTEDYGEDKWLLEADPRIMLELHIDLVHNPRLRRGASLTLADVCEVGAGDAEDPTALLLVAASHAAIGHQFDRLQHLCDIARAAAGRINAERLAAVASRCGLTGAVHAALDVTARVLDTPETRDAGRCLMPSRIDRFAAAIIAIDTVMDGQSLRRGHHSWRRNLLRQAIKLRGRRATVRDKAP